MHLSSQLSREGRRFEEKIKGFSPGKRHYDVQYRIIEKTISAALPTRTTYQLKPRNILFTSQHAPLRTHLDYEFLPTFASHLSSPPPHLSSARGEGRGLKSRCQSAFSRTQTLKKHSQERKAEKVFSSVGVMLQERGRKGEEVYTLNLLRIHGSSEKKIKINNFFY